MDRVLVRYTVKPEKVEENEKLVRAVYAHLKQVNDPGVHYATFKLEDGKTFVHIASFESEEKRKILSESEPFKKFQENIKERCEVPPNPEKLAEIDSFNFA